mmetsp:Transcript_25860/g.60231  ORF Transcript_25860/g.60231 Transcript_25860/m.60231 type:complete len:441 (-) Transcript_25860:181-1503(-)
MTAVLWGGILLFGALTTLGIAAVQFIHPLNQQITESGAYDDCERCGRAFATVGAAMLTFVQQIVAGDSWGLVTIPIIEQQPLSAIFFFFVFVVVCLAIMNVILSVIVDNAMKASHDDLQEVLRAKDKEFKRTAKKFKQICRDLDTDNSGDITFEELQVGFQMNPEFRDHLSALDIRHDDLGLVFSILDTNRSGKVDYSEFTEELFKMKTDNMHTILVFIRFYVLEIRKGVQEQLRVLKSEILEKIQEAEDHAFLPPALTKDSSSSGKASKAEPEQKYIEDKFAASSLRDELQKLRAVISEDLIHSVKDLAENHRDLLRSIPRDVDTRFRDGTARLRDVPTPLTSVLSGHSSLEASGVCKQPRCASVTRDVPTRLCNMLSAQSEGSGSSKPPRSAWASERRWILSECSSGYISTRDEGGAQHVATVPWATVEDGRGGVRAC